ncbi:hypothetical protein J7F01_16825 [Streptomyces sp. ISL-22]|uniref:hypothetical protein n=1 Tax=unclassified Streptomyces TaxID=2593676 RepID=UPI001BEB9050|nr:MULTISPECIES: hypothetical protein [unclassified Streptomyces]MBT2423409.1 hypothetical protein [Streptomyces sp. ISL-24]MBT2433814.1 hypothetical protein [Streptomyces sp. ISL-22]
MAALIQALCKVEADTAVRKLLARDPASHTDLTNGWAVAPLLSALRSAGANAEVQDLLARIPLDRVQVVGMSGTGIDILADELRQANAEAMAAMLLARAKASGSLEFENQFPYGREVDGLPAEPWTAADVLPDALLTGSTP